MKLAIISIILVTSLLAALFFNMELPKHQVLQPQTSYINLLENEITENISQMRQITKHANLKELSQFQHSSSELLKTFKNNASLSTEFINEYQELHAIVMKTAQSIQKKEPNLYHDLENMKRYENSFSKKVKSIGFSELNSSYKKMQKYYKRYLRNPYNVEFENYKRANLQVKNIITELYLDETQENPLYMFLDTQHSVISGFARVYNSVGLRKMRRIKPLMYTLKEHIHFQSSINQKSSARR